MFKLRAQGWPQRLLADRFGVSRTAVSRALSGERWSEVRARIKNPPPILSHAKAVRAANAKLSARQVRSVHRMAASDLRGRCCKTFWLRTGPCRALGADPPRDAELRGDLACRRLGSERKYVKRIHARDTGKAGRQFAR